MCVADRACVPSERTYCTFPPSSSLPSVSVRAHRSASQKVRFGTSSSANAPQARFCLPKRCWTRQRSSCDVHLSHRCAHCCDALQRSVSASCAQPADDSKAETTVAAGQCGGVLSPDFS